MTDEPRAPAPPDEGPGAQAPPAGSQGAEAPPATKPAPPRAGPVNPTPDVPPPPPPMPEPREKLPKGAGPPFWMALLAAVLVVGGLLSFSYSAWSYVSGASAGLAAGEKAMSSIEALEGADIETLSTQARLEFTRRGVELKHEAISKNKASKDLRKTAHTWAYVGVGPLLIGLVLMIVYRKKKERARTARVR